MSASKGGKSSAVDKPLRRLIMRKKVKVLAFAVVDNKVKILGDKRLVSLAKNNQVKVEDILKDLILLEQDNDAIFEYSEETTNLVSLPRTSVKIRSDSWTKVTARETLKQYMKIFNLGRGMSLRYNVKENEPAGWPDSISFEDFKGVSYAKVEEATQIIESLIRYHAKVDPETYFESRRETNEDDAVVDTSEDETEVLGNQELDQPVENGNNEEIDQPEQIHPPNNYENNQTYEYQGNPNYEMPLHLDPSGSWYWNYYLQQWSPYYPQNGDGRLNEG